MLLYTLIQPPEQIIILNWAHSTSISAAALNYTRKREGLVLASSRDGKTLVCCVETLEHTLGAASAHIYAIISPHSLFLGRKPSSLNDRTLVRLSIKRKKDSKD